MGCCETQLVGINGGGDGGELFRGAICGVIGEPTGNATIDASVGWAVDDTETAIIKVTAPLTADITASGAGGLDTGSEASDTWYFLWLIAVPNAPAVMLSASSTAPTMPAGYTLKRRVASVRNNASSDFMQYFSRAFGALRRIEYNEQRNAAPQRVLNNGAATIFTDIDCSDVIPPTTEVGIFEAQTNVDLENGRMRPNGSTDSGGTVFIKEQEQEVFEMTCPGQIVEYDNDPGGTMDVDVIGYWESLCPDDL